MDHAQYNNGFIMQPVEDSKIPHPNPVDWWLECF
jgi:hypothetical protein